MKLHEYLDRILVALEKKPEPLVSVYTLHFDPKDLLPLNADRTFLMSDKGQTQHTYLDPRDIATIEETNIFRNGDIVRVTLRDSRVFHVLDSMASFREKIGR